MQISSSKIDQIHKIFHAKEYYDFRMKKIKRKKKNNNRKSNQHFHS